MRIIYAAYARMPTERAHGIQIAEMCAAYAATGAQVTLLVPARPNSITQTVFSYYGVSETFAVRELPERGLGIFGFLGRRFSFARAAAHYARTVRADVVISRDELMPYFLRTEKRIAAVYECHRIPERFSWLFGCLVHHARYVVSTNEWKKKELARIGVPESRILIAPNGMNLEAFDHAQPRTSFRQEIGVPEDAKLVLYTGHLYEWKGADVLARAAAGFPSGTYAVLIGGFEEEVMAFRARFPAENVKILGARPHAEIARYLKSADVLVVPNVPTTRESTYETSPIKLFECLAAGRPVIVSDLPALREVANETLAWLVPPGDPVALSRAVAFVFEHPSEAVARTAAAIALSQSHSWNERAKRILSFVHANA